MSLAVHVALRGGQAAHSFIVLILSSYVAYEDNRSAIHSPIEINFLILASSFSIIAFLFLKVAPRISTRKPSPLSILIVEALVSFLYMAGFITLSVFLSKLSFCHGRVCGAAIADAVFAAFNYVVWAASATITGMQISRHTDSRAAANFEERKVVEDRV